MRYAPFITEGSEYVHPALEAIVACEDTFEPVRDVCSGALWIVGTTKDLDVKKDDWVALAEYVAQCTACVVAVTMRAVNPRLFEDRLISLSETLQQFQPLITQAIEISQTSSTSLTKRLSLIMRTKTTPGELKARLGRVLVAFELGAMEARNALVKTLGDTDEVVRRVSDFSYQSDLILFAQYTFSNIGKARGLGTTWVEEAQRAQFVQHADGSMLWVEVAGRFLRYCVEPGKELQRLLRLPFLPSSPSSPSDPQAQALDAKMDQLYRAILSSCPWTAWDFNTDYQVVMGILLALKRPLPATAVVSLAAFKSVDKTIKSLLLTGIVAEEDDGEKLVVHDSFRGFMARQAAAATASLSDMDKRYIIKQERPDARIALNALGIINKELPAIAPALDNIVAMLKTHKTEPIPPPPDGVVSDALRYSCQFFVAHLKVLKTKPTQGLYDAVRLFLDKNVSLWMKLCASMGAFQGTSELLAWCKEVGSTARKVVRPHNMAYDTYYIALHLRDMGRHQEALIANRESLEFYREMYEKKPNDPEYDFGRNVASGLNWVATDLIHTDQWEGALELAHESLRLYRQLGKDRPIKMDHGQGEVLDSIVKILAKFRRKAEALEPAREAVAWRRPLAEADPGKYKSTLAMALNNRSIILGENGDWEEALAACREAVEIYREEVKREDLSPRESRARATSLAGAVNQLAKCLFNAGEREASLPVIQEAVDMRRRLAEAQDKPGDPMSHLASSLHNQAYYLGETGRDDEALAPIRECVELRRELARAKGGVYSKTFPDTLNLLYSILKSLRQYEEARPIRDEYWAVKSDSSYVD